MGSIISKIRGKKIDHQMDDLHQKIQYYENITKFYGHIDIFCGRSMFFGIIIGVSILFASLYSYNIKQNKTWMKLAVISIFLTISVYFTLYYSRAYCRYRIQRASKDLIRDRQRLRELFIKYLDIGSYKNVLNLQKKYDPENTLLNNIEILQPIIPTTSNKSNNSKVTDKKRPTSTTTVEIIPKTLKNNETPAKSINRLNNSENDSNELSLQVLDPINLKKPTMSLNNISENVDIKNNKLKVPHITSNFQPVKSSSTSANDEGPPFQIYKNRTIFDKIIDKILGDGPENRNALICDRCFTHNGLVPPEDFLHVSYRCYNCHKFHGPRQSVSMFARNAEPNNNETSVYDSNYDDSIFQNYKLANSEVLFNNKIITLPSDKSLYQSPSNLVSIIEPCQSAQMSNIPKNPTTEKLSFPFQSLVQDKNYQLATLLNASSLINNFNRIIDKNDKNSPFNPVIASNNNVPCSTPINLNEIQNNENTNSNIKDQLTLSDYSIVEKSQDEPNLNTSNIEQPKSYTFDHNVTDPIVSINNDAKNIDTFEKNDKNIETDNTETITLANDDENMTKTTIPIIKEINTNLNDDENTSNDYNKKN